MIATAIRSARRVGVQEDFHVWSDVTVDGATTHALGECDKQYYWFKFSYLKRFAQRLNYKYFIWIDADSYFVRNPGDLSRLLRNAPLHSFLESDLCLEESYRKEWWDCPLPKYVDLMRRCGVTSNSIFNVNAGFWIVHRSAISTLCRLARYFWSTSNQEGFQFTEEAPLAYATHMLGGNPYAHTLKVNSQVWASDWTGKFADRLPTASSWLFEDYFTGNRYRVNPCIVHAMRSKDALIAANDR